MPTTEALSTTNSLTAQRAETLRQLTNCLIPADEDTPGGVEAGVPDFLVTLFATARAGQAAEFYALLDALTAQDFIAFTPEAQTALLHEVERGAVPDATPTTFALIVECAAEGFYTSPAGMRLIGYNPKGGVAR